jgi:cyanophycinase
MRYPLRKKNDMKRTSVLAIGLLALASVGAACAADAGPKGTLFIIGGGDRPQAMMQRFVDLALKAPGGKIVVFPQASAEAEASGTGLAEELRKLGAPEVRSLNLTREEALKPGSAALLDGVGGIYFCGGDQSRLTAVLLDTPIHARMKVLYENGAVVGGTSAGAAVMSEVMITGDEKKKPAAGSEWQTIEADNVITVRGFGFLTSAIVDQHFATRRSHNRLISLVLEHPELVGIGIDESTAAVVTGGNTFEVVGGKDIVVYDATKAKVARNGVFLGGTGLAFHVLLPGDRYDIVRRAVLPR